MISGETTHERKRNATWQRQVIKYPYMKLHFNHVFGKITKMDIQYTPVYATVEPHEVEHALGTGWVKLYWDEDNNPSNLWQQIRSTRINLNEYKASKNHRKTLKQEIHVSVKPYAEADQSKILTLYKEYLAYKKFDSWDKPIPGSTIFEYSYEGQLIGFTLCEEHKHSMESLIFAWNYKHPQLRLGQFSLLHEMMYAKNKKLRYLYLSAGYEVASKYKADYKGFEWWTGSNWSKDKELYRKSCDADSRIQTIKDLAEYETNWMKAVQTDK